MCIVLDTADALKAAGFCQICYKGDESISFIDQHYCLLFVLGSLLRNVPVWRVKVEQEVICAIKEELDGITFNTKEREHKRECFLITAVSVSYRSKEEIRMVYLLSFIFANFLLGARELLPF